MKENEQILTEKELSAKYNAGRITVRKAIEILSDEDLLTSKQGMGTFVTGKRLVRSLNNPYELLPELHPERAEAGHEISVGGHQTRCPTT